MKILLILAMVAGVVAALYADTTPVTQRIRSDYATIEKTITERGYMHSTITIGGGQNPNEIDVWYIGGTEKDFMNDPYDAPFFVRRITMTKMLPAVGHTSMQMNYDDAGEVFFIFGQGVDFVNSGLELMAASSYRVYFQNKKAYKIIVENAPPDGKTYTIDARTEKSADKVAFVEKVGKVLFDYAQTMREAMNTLAW